MLARRLIPCLDVMGGRVVKGTRFLNLRDAGDPVELAAAYDREGADEVVFLDITASHEKRRTLIDLARRAAEQVFIPLTIGGGVSSVEEVQVLLRAGADKVGINSAAVADPGLIAGAAEVFGSQCIVVAVDARRRDPEDPGAGWEVYVHGGRTPTGRCAVAWAGQASRLGAGEILLTSMDCDGTGDGYDIELLQAVDRVVTCPVIASGGAGSLEHLLRALDEGRADAVLAASIFHYGQYSIAEAKDFLRRHGVPVRL